jgi:uncharacterized cupin superfamily protein
VHFPRGPDGAHGLANETEEPVRVLMASTSSRRRSRSTRDHKQMTAQVRTGSQTGDQLWLITASSLLTPEGSSALRSRPAMAQRLTSASP